MKVSALEARFAQYCALAGLPRPVAQFRACPPRMFRWDFAWPKVKLLVEIQGGTWTRGAHGRGAGIDRDYAKNNAAVEAGYRVLYFSSSMIRDSAAVIETLRKVLHEHEA